MLWPDLVFPDTTVHFVWISGVTMGHLLAKRLIFWNQKLSPRSMEGRGWVSHGTDRVPGTNGLCLGMFCGSDTIAVDVFQENFQPL